MILPLKPHFLLIYFPTFPGYTIYLIITKLSIIATQLHKRQNCSGQHLQHPRVTKTAFQYAYPRKTCSTSTETPKHSLTRVSSFNILKQIYIPRNVPIMKLNICKRNTITTHEDNGYFNGDKRRIVQPIAPAPIGLVERLQIAPLTRLID